jgi:Tubulin C-terminal domain
MLCFTIYYAIKVLDEIENQNASSSKTAVLDVMRSFFQPTNWMVLVPTRTECCLSECAIIKEIWIERMSTTHYSEAMSKEIRHFSRARSQSRTSTADPRTSRQPVVSPDLCSLTTQVFTILLSNTLAAQAAKRQPFLETYQCNKMFDAAN